MEAPSRGNGGGPGKSPLSRGRKSGRISWQLRVGVLQARRDVGGESRRVSLEICGVFPTLATPLPPAPALPWLLKGRKMSSKFWESNSCASYSSRLHGNGSRSQRNSPFHRDSRCGTAGDKFRTFLSCLFVKRIPWLQLSFVLEVSVIKTLQAYSGLDRNVAFTLMEGWFPQTIQKKKSGIYL